MTPGCHTQFYTTLTDATQAKDTRCVTFAVLRVFGFWS